MTLCTVISNSEYKIINELKSAYWARSGWTWSWGI